MLQGKWKADIKKLTNSPLVGNLTKQFNVYEDRVRRFVRDIDLRSREARVTSKKRIDIFTSQLKERRFEVEKKVTRLLNDEGKRLNGRVNELVGYLKSLAQLEKEASKKGTSSRKKANRSGASVKRRASRKGSAASSSQASSPSIN